MYNFHSLHIDVHGRTSGRIKTFCPKCHEQRHDKRDKSLSVNLDTGQYKCHYCDFKGYAGTPAGKLGSAASAPGTGTLPDASLPAWKPGCSTLLPEGLVRWLTEVRHISLKAAERLGIGFATEYMPQTQKKEESLCFHYYEDGERVNTKFRDLQKNFKFISGAELIPYNIDGVKNTPEVIITEGELDAASFVTAGRTDVVSVPGGANRNLTWMDRFVESHFDDKRVIYIAVDTDPKGEILKQELLRRLGHERCRVVTYGEGCKDANELLVKSGKDALLQALADAPEQPLEGVFTAADVRDDLRALFENGLNRGADIGLENFDALCTFELGRLCVVTGHPGDGKSEFVDELVLRLCLRHEWRIAYFSPENLPLSYHLSKLFEKLTGNHFKQGYMSELRYEAAERFLADNVSSLLPKEDFCVESILSRARELVSRRGIRILVIDPFNRLEHRIPAGQTETQYISAFLDQLSGFAVRNRCLVILVAHPRKMQRDPATGQLPVPTLQDINGSAAFVNKCDFGLVVERDRAAGVTRIHVKKVKFRHLGNLGDCTFVYNLANGRYSPCTGEGNGVEFKIIKTDFDSLPWIGQEEVKQREMF
ncbi:bifunctional DNA primase/helicase [Bacteroides sp.]